MKKSILFCALSLISLPLLAQLDNPTQTVKAPDGLLQSPESEEEKTSLLRASGNHSLSNKKGLLPSSNLKLGEEDKPSFSMRTDNGLMTYRPKDFSPKAFPKDKDNSTFSHKEQYLGDLKTGGGFVELYCRDHEFVDGDRIRVYVNGEMIHNNILLSSGYYPILVRLNMGFNTIEFEALNQGTSGPNTAELRIFDENGMEMAKKEWNLMTGGKANLIVVKQ